MKKLIMIALMAISVSAMAQDVVKNGTIYKKHPYITKIIQLNTLFPKGDTIAVAGYYADTVKFYDATEPDKP